MAITPAMNAETKETILAALSAAIASAERAGEPWPDAIDGMRICGYRVGCDVKYPRYEDGYYVASLRPTGARRWEYDILYAPQAPQGMRIVPVSERG